MYTTTGISGRDRQSCCPAAVQMMLVKGAWHPGKGGAVAASNHIITSCCCCCCFLFAASFSAFDFVCLLLLFVFALLNLLLPLPSPPRTPPHFELFIAHCAGSKGKYCISPRMTTSCSCPSSLVLPPTHPPPCSLQRICVCVMSVVKKL